MLNSSTTFSNINNPARTSRGSALMVALFVIIVMALLGTAIVGMQRTSSETIAQEVYGTRALMAARSGMQTQLFKLFPLEGVSSACPSYTARYDFENRDDEPKLGLLNCEARVTCEVYATVNTVDYYRLQSIGTCRSGDLASNSTNVVISSRTVQVEARDIE